MSKLNRISSGLLAGCLMAALPLLAQSGVQTQTVVTVLPKSGNQTLTIPETHVQANVDGKSARITTPAATTASSAMGLASVDRSFRIA